MVRLIILFLILSIPSYSFAHRSGCHRWHSCPSDRGTYTCGDTGHCSGCGDNQYCQNGGVRAFNSPVEEEPKAEEASKETTVKEITGAFGVTFGETVETLKSNGFDPVQGKAKGAIYNFQPQKKYKVFSNYLVKVTPKSRKIFTVGGIGKTEAMKACQKELNTLEKILTKKYGKAVNKTNKLVFINQANSGIRVLCQMSSGDVATLSIYYLHFGLQDQGKKEEMEIERQDKKLDIDEFGGSGL